MPSAVRYGIFQSAAPLSSFHAPAPFPLTAPQIFGTLKPANRIVHPFGDPSAGGTDGDVAKNAESVYAAVYTTIVRERIV